MIRAVGLFLLALSPALVCAQDDESLLQPGQSSYFRPNDFREPTEKDQRYARAVTARLGAKKPLGLQSFVVPERAAGDPQATLPGCRGLAFRARLKDGYVGLVRLRFEAPASALALLEEFTRKAPSDRVRRVHEQRGVDMVWLLGDSTLRNPRRTASYLESAWTAGKRTPPTGGSTLSSTPIPESGRRHDALAFFTQGRGYLYQHAGLLLRAMRSFALVAEMKPGPGTDAFRERFRRAYGERLESMRRAFSDEARNDLQAGEKDSEMRILAAPNGIAYARGQSKPARDREWSYLQALLKARNTLPEPSLETVDVELDIDRRKKKPAAPR